MAEVAVAVAAALLLSAVIVGAQRAAVAQGQFSERELERLEDGELVARKEHKRKGEYRLIGGTSWQRIEAPPDKVWRMATDVSAYADYVPVTKEARTVEENDHTRVVYFQHEYGMIEASYQLRMQIMKSAHAGQFKLDKSQEGDLRQGYGFFRINGPDEGPTTVTWGIMADVGKGLVSGVLRQVLHKWMLRVPACLEGYVETDGRSDDPCHHQD